MAFWRVDIPRKRRALEMPTFELACLLGIAAIDTVQPRAHVMTLKGPPRRGALTTHYTKWIAKGIRGKRLGREQRPNMKGSNSIWEVNGLSYLVLFLFIY